VLPWQVLGVSEEKGGDAMEQLRGVSVESIERKAPANSIDEAVNALLLEGVQQAQALDQRAETTSRTTKGGGEFTFGDQDHFVLGLQGMIGLPDGLNEKQWCSAGTLPDDS